MNKTISILIVILVVGVGVFFYFRKPAEAPTSGIEKESPVVEQKAAEPIVVKLAALKDSGESGTATIFEENGKTKVLLSIVGAPKNTPQPAHIHAGSCTAPGSIIYTLASVANGGSDTMLEMPLKNIMDKLPLALVVHKSETAMGTYVSCGDVRGTSVGSTGGAIEVATIEISDNGFSPATLTVKAGTTVTFKNVGTGDSWPASAKHPLHLVYLDQDSCFAGKFTGCGIPGGGSWSYTFKQKGSWAYHDHLRSTLFGKIIIE